MSPRIFTAPKVTAAVREYLRQHTGLSAATIASVLVPVLRDYCDGICGWSGLGNYPHDPDDYSRCRGVLALVPNGVARIGEVAAAFPCKEWEDLAAAWPEFEALWLKEEKRPDRTMPKLYARMQRALGLAGRKR